MKHHDFGPSTLERREICPASYNEEKNKPDIPNVYAESGNRIHAKLAGENIELSNDEQITANKIQQKIDEILAQTNLEFTFNEYPVELYDENNFLINSGTVDMCGIIDIENGVLIDYKTGFKQVEHAIDNIQTVNYAMAFMQMRSLKYCDVYIIQPNCNTDVTHHRFGYNTSIIKYIKSVIEKCLVPNPDYNPCEKACQYCKGKLTCKALKGELQTISNTINLPDIPDTELISLYEKSKTVQKLIDAIKDELKIRVKKNGNCGDYKIKKTSGGYEFNSILNVIDILKNKHSFSDSNFDDCLTLSVLKTKEVFLKLGSEMYGLSKEDLIKKFTDEFSEYMTEKPNREHICK